MKTLRYVAIIEEGRRNHSAYLPDLPGCVATGKTREECEREIGRAAEFHVEGLVLEGLPVPEPISTAIAVEIEAA